MSGSVGPWRLWQGTPGAASIRDQWGTFLNTNASLLQAGATGIAAVNIGGMSTYSLTANNYAADQSRPLIQNYTGALTGDCTVTIPNVQKVGWAINNTSGGHNVILTSGGGTTATVPPDGRWWWYWCDGAGNVSTPSVAFGNVDAPIVNAGSVVSSGGISGFSLNISNNGTIANTLTVGGALINGASGGVILGGVTTNTAAAAGKVGEVITSAVAGVAMTTGANINITSISLTAGDWDVFGVVKFNPSGTPSALNAAINTASGTLPALTNGGYASIQATFPAGGGQVLPAATVRLLLSGTTTVYLIGGANFSSTMTADGVIIARRRR